MGPSAFSFLEQRNLNRRAYRMDLESIYAIPAAQGMRIIETESCVWVAKRNFYLESAPGHRRMRLKPGEAAKIFLRGFVALRYTCPDDEGSSSFEYVCTDKGFGLETLAPDARRRVRRGLESCEIKRADFDQLGREGCAINRSVFTRQGRVESSFLTDELQWNRYMKICGRLPNIEAYGAFIHGKLIGFSFIVFVDDYCYLFHTHAFADSMRFSPINALTFTAMKTALSRQSVNCISQGFESFRMLPEVERFKLSMGFNKRPIGRRVLINPAMRAAFSPSGSWLVSKLLQRTRPDLLNDFSTFARSVREGRMLAAVQS
jgi:hypothetical protein